MPLLGVTVCPSLSEKEKKQHGKHGCHVSQQPTHLFLSFPNDHIPSHIQALFENFTSMMYVATTGFSKVDQLRRHLFCTENKPLHLIPPSSATLVQHCLRAAYQAGQIWGRSLDMLKCDPPTPISWGWVQRNEVWEPVWSTLSSI
ncbi:unnamed protein product [Psylliodes chrysocephalus]|uniref:Uncharacterized protein n=1 Tax=Psylliodes chrysocephalus TaxID=3402493 RepID=A0A9P0GBU4_9CUCU|nr:unnamed protein product [Psylliodes chrysocephala]